MTSSKEKILNKIKYYEDDIKSTKDYLHLYPELSSKEFQTSAYLKKRCKDMGLFVEDVEDSTGFTALLDTGKAGKTLGIRTDIDALAIKESEFNLKDKKKLVSKNVGVSHACGHDSHMTMVLILARILLDLKEELSGKIYFIFEEAEETGQGIEKMLRHLKDKGLDAVYGNHNSPDLDIGKFSVLKGPSHAGCIAIDFDVIGKGGHGSRPDRLINPLTAACNIVTGITNAWVNQIDVTKTVTFGLGAINGGTSANVIPDKCKVKATLRFFDVNEGIHALEVLKEVAEFTARAHKCEVEFTENTGLMARPVINDSNLAEFIRKSLQSIYPDSLVEAEAEYISETFYGYGKLCPSVITKFGVRDESRGYGSDLHTKEFDLSYESIEFAIGLAGKFAVDFLSQEGI